MVTTFIVAGHNGKDERRPAPQIAVEGLLVPGDMRGRFGKIGRSSIPDLPPEAGG